MRYERRTRAVTMTDVAARAGVSRALVSIVFRGAPGASAATRERVMRAAEELSYRPDQRARLLGSKRSRTIGVVFGLHHEFHGEVVEGLYQAAERVGYELALGAVAPSRSEPRAIQSLEDYRCEALILVGPHLALGAIDELAGRVPTVVIARALRTTAADVVRTDDAAGATLAVNHLVSLGHRRIAHVHGGRAPGAAERRNGYRAAMRAAGLARSERLVAGGLTEEHGVAAAHELIGRRTPTAALAFNDHCAVGLLATASQRGVEVPGAMSVVGYDNSHVAGLSTVGLTTVAQDSTTLADRAVEIAVAHAEGRAGERSEVLVPPQLVTRRTTAAPSEAG